MQRHEMIEAMRALRTRVHADNPELAHDFTALRKLSLAHVFEPFGHGEELVERAFEVFYAARNRVELYPDAGPALQRLAGRFPIASLSNGNADLHRIGLGEYFVATVTARTVGVGKPHPRIFARAVACLGLPATQVAHVGDDPLLDVQGAQRAGLVAVWLNRSGAAWPLPRPPHIQVAGLGALEPALGRYAGHGAIAGGIR